MAKEFTREEVAKHNTLNDCWIIVNNRVYDVTNFLLEHPAGRGIIMLHAGKDCTKEFLDVHKEEYIPSFAPKAFVGIVAGSNAGGPPPRAAGAGPVDFDTEKVLIMKRDLYGPEHEAFRAKFKAFLRQEVLPQLSKFEIKGAVDGAMYKKMAENGFYLTLGIPEEHGGTGLGYKDWRFNAIICEELENNDCGTYFVNLGNDMVLSYFTKCCTPEQAKKWWPALVRGAPIAIAMSEPEVGSDLGKLSCRAERTADGWILNGRKMWISAGAVAELIVVSAVTDPSKGAKGISLMVVERGMEGYEVAKKFGKLGKHASDTCLLTFENVKVPKENLVGVEGQGFIYMMQNLAKERLSIAVGSAAAARRALALATNYVNGRASFGGVFGNMQHIQMKLAQIRGEVQVCTTFVDRCIADVSAGKLSAEAASMAKAYTTDLSFRVADSCLQAFGGYGYLKNSPIGKLMVDQRVVRIYGGSNEVQWEIVSKGLGFTPQRMGKL
eukprot:CAMPEP_0206466848 /NCGR_PEP_ID=MMETSP0324_2-20121206/28700_1 /ASSEMBLY_ACC=CAM_ASM_000836 /TAXON_ID=2866 /ORGANISM="Crypthecodinium cohnii, Strain Seligo" /LENGTH=494 /DNA_ID=CAMNT_0053940037 /DNA_START=64 /DNA_END=1548 /DNA_ORIENTATION=+